MEKILIVEDEAHLAQGLLFNLQAEGYEAQVENDGESALAALNSGEHYDAVLLDVMLPGKSGFEVAAELRAQENFIPILLLTARSRPEDVVLGFESGADDYLPKPFDLSVLLARLNGLLRRMSWHAVPHAAESPADSASLPQETAEPGDFLFAGRRIDFDSLELHAHERVVHLTLMEADLLRYLVQNRGRIVSRKELLEQVWHVHEDTDTRAIDNFIVRLRRYLEDEPASPKYLQTVRGVGYRFLPEAE
ncbi:response regulator transcription factor [Paracidobacterium acidisoli]|uniref:DNA-binding response regulator n=1 Tax=Paracidobacterium acidisoli TaxID=2303751 RepID=A0A372IU81_9BACT|nr:response regulator transcription factor [Paracidobacterium acidisoli]MBT9329953.1 response regulator transcription factor [Paracidobacterium acidisoli]